MEIKSTEIEIAKIESIVPHPKNPNKHSDLQILRLSKLIQNTGFRSPLIVSNQSGFLIVGHCRLMAAKLLKMESVPVIFQDFKNEAEEYQFMTADNAIASWSELNKEQIKLDIEEFEDFEIDLLGIKDFDFDGLDVEDDSNDKLIDDNKKYLLLLEFKDENELQMFFNEMQSREVKCTIME